MTAANRPDSTYWVRIPTWHDEIGLLDFVNDRDTITQRAIRRSGIAGYQPATAAGILTALELARRPLVFFDVGANAGLYSLLCKRIWRDAQVVAFEPFDRTADAAEQIAAANGLDITVERTAVSEDDGTARLLLSSRSDASHSLEQAPRSTGAVEVATVSIDSYVARTGVAPTVMKVDVEMHEPAVLRGAWDVLATRRPVLIVELLPDGGKIAAPGRAALQMLGDLGYVAHHLTPHPDVPVAGDPDTWRDWLFWPGELPRGFDTTFLGWSRAVARCERVRARPADQRALLAEV